MINEKETGGGFSITALIVFLTTIAIFVVGGYAAYQYIFLNLPVSTVDFVGAFLGTALAFVKNNLVFVLGLGGLLILVSVLGVALALFGLSKLYK